MQLEALTNKMIGLRYHSMLALTSDCFVVHGGQHFKAISSKNVNGQLYAGIRQRPFSKCKVKWFTVKMAKPLQRFAHKLAIINNEIWCIGGFENSNDKESAKTLRLQLQESQ